ncbi:MAG: hypothetical protein BWY76_01752 [bacterium ADurb.Bin429]|nr:MAG: hypothetical protein BWY76_01752 [bacterium ADurb.Bin429]
MYLLMLRMMGFAVRAVGDAAAARGVLEREPVALLLTDWYLPEPEGILLISEVRQRDMAVRTILMSNAWHVAPVADAAGADGWYRKGESLDDLRALIQRLLTPVEIHDTAAAALA